jgi:hypothetical protein
MWKVAFASTKGSALSLRLARCWQPRTSDEMPSPEPRRGVSPLRAKTTMIGGKPERERPWMDAASRPPTAVSECGECVDESFSV